MLVHTPHETAVSKNRLHEVLTLLYPKIDLATYDITQEPAINRFLFYMQRHTV